MTPPRALQRRTLARLAEPRNGRVHVRNRRRAGRALYYFKHSILLYYYPSLLLLGTAGIHDAVTQLYYSTILLKYYTTRRLDYTRVAGT